MTNNAEIASSLPTFKEELNLAFHLWNLTFNDLKLATTNFRPESLLRKGEFIIQFLTILFYFILFKKTKRKVLRKDDKINT